MSLLVILIFLKKKFSNETYNDINFFIYRHNNFKKENNRVYTF